MANTWLTYAEAGELLGIKAASAKKRAIRKHWPKQIGNDGLSRIQIPDGVTRTNIASDVPGDVPGLVPSHATNDETGDMSRLRRELADAREDLAHERGENKANRERIEQMTKEIDRLLTILEARPVGFIARLFRRD